MNYPRYLLLLTATFLVACAGPTALVPGTSTQADLTNALGQPALRWTTPDSTEQQAYPTGPLGEQTWMAHVSADGRLISVENVLRREVFDQIQPGMTQEQVLRLIGPPNVDRTRYFAARNELAWEWRYRSVWGETTGFNVLFDGMEGPVRSTLHVVLEPEIIGPNFGRR